MIINNKKFRDVNKINRIYIVISLLLLLVIVLLSIMTGRYPLSLSEILAHNKTQLMVLKRLRIPRAVMGVVGGFGLGITGYIYQLIFKNPLASPDIVGVSSGASAGAAFAIVCVSSFVPVVSVIAFAGAMAALLLTLLISYIVPGKNSNTVVLSGIAIHSVAQTILMFLKLAADPEKQLASIEYWIMGSLNAVSLDNLLLPCIITFFGAVIIIMLHRQIFLLSLDEAEASALGVNVSLLRMIILIIATLIVSSIICTTGLISFIGLLAPHIARLFIKKNNTHSLILSGIMGSLLLTSADILARIVASSELPVSIFTSLIGAPLLILLLVKNNSR